MDRADLDHLEALHRAATPGPWESNSERDAYLGIDCVNIRRDPYAGPDDFVMFTDSDMSSADAALIAAARNALPALLSRLRALEEVARAAESYVQVPSTADHRPEAEKLRAALAAAKEGA